MLQTYIGTKIIKAKPATNVEAGAIRVGCSVEDQRAHYQKNKIPERPGYYVEYPDGYQSWSPKETFEEAYKQCDNMTFGLAIEALKKGKKVARRGWNGKGMFIYLQEGSNPYYHDLKMNVQVALANTHCVDENGRVNLCPHIDMKAADGSIVIGWLASQTDMLADDWMIIE